MKALKFFLLFALAVILHGCAQDDFETYTTDAEKIALYKAKAKEFAEKYGITLSLNEEGIQELIRTTSIEEMEKDIEYISNISIEYTVQNKTSKNRLKIRKKISISESHDDRDGQFDFSYADARGWVDGTVDWHYRFKGLSSLNVSYSYQNSSTYTSRICPVNMNYNKGIYFDVFGVYRFESSRYQFDSFVSISFNEETGAHRVRIGSY